MSSVVSLSLHAAHVERGDVVAATDVPGSTATQMLHFYDDADRCVLVMTLMWPRGVDCAPIVAHQQRAAGERD